MVSDISVQEPGELVVERPVRVKGGPVVVVVNEPRMSRKVSFTFAVVDRIKSASVKLTDGPPTVIALAQEDPLLVKEVIARLRSSGEIANDDLVYLDRIADRWIGIADTNRRRTATALST